MAHKCVDIKDEDVHTHYVMIFIVNHNVEIIKGKNIQRFTYLAPEVDYIGATPHHEEKATKSGRHPLGTLAGFPFVHINLDC